MELIEEGQPFTVIVDFAHAPEALKRVLTFIRGRSAGRIIAVFGCIGERDKDRRAVLALPAILADAGLVIVRVGPGAATAPATAVPDSRSGPPSTPGPNAGGAGSGSGPRPHARVRSGGLLRARSR